MVEHLMDKEHKLGGSVLWPCGVRFARPKKLLGRRDLGKSGSTPLGSLVPEAKTIGFESIESENSGRIIGACLRGRFESQEGIDDGIQSRQGIEVRTGDLHPAVPMVGR